MTAPLAPYLILDLTHVLAGPFATMIAHDLGATVIKVERPGLGDDTRAFPPFKDGLSAYFAAINHGKQSIVLDLKAEADRAIFEDLLARADMVVENFRPGTMEALGYGWDDLHARFPKLIYGAVSGFGHTGPDSQKPAYDMVVQGRGGLMSITGEAGREPVRVGSSVGDIVAGLYLAIGLFAALAERERTGEGRKVDIAMLDCQLAILEHAIALTTVNGVPPKPTGARHPSITPFETYHASDGLVILAAGNDAVFERLCGVLDLPLADDPRFKTNVSRCENAKLLKRLIEAVTLGEPVQYWLDLCDRAGVPAARIQNVAEALEDPQLIARNMVVDVLGQDGKPAYVAAGNPIKISGMDDPLTRGPAPRLDGDRAAVLRFLGRD